MNHAPDQQLIEPVQAGDEAAVAQALADGFGAHRGGLQRQAGSRRLLVDASARIGPFGYFHVTPLRIAMLEPHADVVQSLIAHRVALPGFSPGA